MMIWNLWAGLAVLFVAALVIAMRSVKQGRWLMLPLLAIVVLPAYYHWGAWASLQRVQDEQRKQEQAKALLATISSSDELIGKLRARLDDTPASARGWYLLGRLYSGQQQWTMARDAYAKSHQLNPDDERATLAYADSLWQLNNQVFDDRIRALLQQVLQKDAKQPDALSMLAMDAFAQKNYALAQRYWRQVLVLMPEHSEEAQALRKAIAKARQLEQE